MLPAFSRIIFSVLALVLSQPSPSLAEDTKPPEVQKEEPKKDESRPVPAETAKEAAPGAQQDATQEARAQAARQIEQYREISGRAQEAMKEFNKNLDAAAAKHFYMMYQNYNLIETVHLVKGDVGNAVKMCSEKNPGLKDKLSERFTGWNKKVGGVLGEAEGNLKNMLISQDYAEPAKIQKVFDIMDEARQLMQNPAGKTPVTTEEACNYLYDKMGQTQESLIRLLQSTLVSFGSTYPELPVSPKAVPVADDKSAAEPAAGDVKKDGPAPEGAKKD